MDFEKIKEYYHLICQAKYKTKESFISWHDGNMEKITDVKIIGNSVLCIQVEGSKRWFLVEDIDLIIVN